VKPILVLCLGNEVLSDDRFGAEIADQLRGDDFGPDVEVVFVSAAGFTLVDLLANRQSALIVDTILTGNAAPGTIHFFPMGNLTPSRSLINSHQINLPTAIAFGRKMGYVMPDDIQVLAVEAQDVTTLAERLTEPVAAALDEAASRVRSWVESKKQRSGDHA
jgi:hydrogenase maturation protease